MAYVDTNLRPSPASMGAAIAVNALIIAGVILAVPHVSGDHSDPPLIIDMIPQPKPPEVIVDNKKPAVTGEVAQKQSRTQPSVTDQDSDNGMIATGIGTIDFPPPGPIEPIGAINIDPIPARIIFKDATVHPRYRDALQPDYPPGLIRREIEGAVTIRVLVGTDGRVKSIEPVRFDDQELLQVTEQHALRKWRFLPATRDGVPVESWREMSVRFQIPD